MTGLPTPGRTLWQTVEAGRLPEHYQWQIQHQLMVTRGDVADVYIFDGTEGVIFPVAPDPTSWPRICTAWDAFGRYVTEAQAPPLTDRDTRVRDHPEGSMRGQVRRTGSVGASTTRACRPVRGRRSGASRAVVSR